VSEPSIRAPQTAAAHPHRALLWLEWSALFVLVPFVAWLDVVHVSKFAIFALPVAYAGVATLVVRRARRRSALNSDAIAADPKRPHSPLAAHVRRGLLVGVCAAAALFAFAALWNPERFLHLPRERPTLMLVILVAYPFVSAAPQEFLYRSFYFARYRALVPGRRAFVAWNAASFAFLHAMYDHPLTLALTLLGGFVFALEYERRRSFLAVWLVHALAGLAVFASGLDLYFYEPITAAAGAD
jgi:hypothetical protein